MRKIFIIGLEIEDSESPPNEPIEAGRIDVVLQHSTVREALATALNCEVVTLQTLKWSS